MIYLRHAFRELQRRPGRWVVSLFSVVIAVAAIVAVSSATSTTRMAYQQVFDALAGRADFEVVAHGGGQFKEDVAEKLRAVPGTETVLPVFHRGTIIYANDKKAKGLALGVLTDEPESVAGIQVEAGQMPTKPGEVALQSSLAESLGVKVGQEVRLLTSRGLRHYHVTGIVEPESAVRLRQGGMVLARLETLQRDFRAVGMVDSLQIFLSPEADATQAMADYTRILPSELTAQIPSTRNGLAEETLLLTNVSLDMASALSFTTAVFIVLSVFLMNVGEQRRQLSILRAVGATRRQIMGMVSAEALMMGIVGTLLGIPLGMYGGRLLIRSMANLLQTDLPEAVQLHWVMVAGAVVGPLLCLLAAWYPARRAAMVSPLEGMRPGVLLDPRPARSWTTWVGTAGLLLSLVWTYYVVRGELPVWVAVLGLIVSLVSLVLLIPVVLKPIVYLLGFFLGRFLGLEGEMAERIVLRRIGRSALTIGVLFIAVSAAVGTSNAVFSINDDIRRWYEQTITADFLLRPMMLEMTGEKGASMSESLTAKLAAMPGVETVDPVSLVRVDAGGVDAMLLARKFSLYDEIPLDVIKGDQKTLDKQLQAGETVVGSVLAERTGVKPGDMLKVTLGTQTHEFRVAAIATEYTFGGSILSIDRSVAQNVLKIEGVDTYLIKAQQKSLGPLKKELQALADKEGLLLQSFVELWDLINSMVTGVTGGLWVLLTLGLFVGALGVVNTLTMNVLEQTKELGMLRAIGMRRRQIVKTVLGQAAYLGIIGIVAGAVSGLSLAHSINLTLGSLFGRYVPFAMRGSFLLGLVTAALAVVMVSALWPALRAARLNPIQAMRED